MAQLQSTSVTGTLTTTGNTGIGTANPEAKLDVRAGSGFIRLGSYDNNYHVKIESGDQLNFYNGASTTTAYIQYNGPSNTLLGRNLYVEGNSSGGATGAVRIKSDGNVGIGTASPSKKFVVTGAANDEWIATFTNTGTNPYGVYIDTSANSGTVFSFATYTNAGTGLFVRNNGLVGIGTAGPTYKLHVYAGTDLLRLQSTGTDARINIGHSANGGYIGYTNLGATSNVFYVTTGAGTIGSGFVMDNNGNVGIGTTSPNRKLTVAGNGTLFGLQSAQVGGYSEMEFTAAGVGGAYVFKASAGFTNYGGAGAFNYYNTGAHAFHSNSVNNILHLTAAGNVGIGTTSPAYKLEVVGGSVNTQIARFITADYPAHSVGLGVDAQSTYWGASIFQDDVKRFTIDSTGGILVGGNYQGSDAPSNGAAIEGNVGIGLTNPGHALDVNGNIRVQGGNRKLVFNNGSVEASLDQVTGASAGLFTLANVGIGTNSPSYPLHVAGNTYSAGVISETFWTNNTIRKLNANDVINFRNSAGTIEMILSSSGELGIGVTNPTYKLQVAGGIYSSDTITTAGYVFANGESLATSLRVGGIYGNLGLYVPSDYNMQFDLGWNGAFTWTRGNAEKMRLTYDGNVGIGTGTPFTSLHIARAAAVAPVIRLQTTDSTTNGAIQWTNSTNTQLALIGSNYNIGDGSGNLEFATGGGSTRMVINSGGNVGIGLTNPGATFVVGAQSSGQAGSGYESDNSILSRLGASNSGRRMIGLTIANTAAAAVGNDASLSFIVASNYSATGIISTILQNTSTAYSDMTFSVYNGSGNPERMRITGETGNVGIGTTSPGWKLDVVGNARIGDNTNQKTLAALNVSAGQGTATTYRDIDIHGSWAGGEGHAITATYDSSATNIVGQVVFEHNGPGSRIKFGRLYDNGDKSTYPMNLVSNGSNGNLGINTTAPAADLHIDSGVTGATAYPFRTDAASLDYALYVSSSGNVAVGGLVPASQLNHKFVVYSGSIALRGPNESGYSYRLNDTAGTNRNALYVSSSNYLNVGNAAFAGIELFHTGSFETRYAPSVTFEESRIYGNIEDNQLLGLPDKWLAVRVGGANFVLPMYEV